jgi:hypothetical protein
MAFLPAGISRVQQTHGFNRWRGALFRFLTNWRSDDGQLAPAALLADGRLDGASRHARIFGVLAKNAMPLASSVKPVSSQIVLADRFFRQRPPMRRPCNTSTMRPVPAPDAASR